MFIDVLRHTFWRPREILIYFAKIITVLTALKYKDMSMNKYAVEKCISDTTREIIKSEFITEFNRYCLNLEDVINRFRRSSQIIDGFVLDEKIGNFPFRFADDTTPVYDRSKKIKFLYEIGFLGIEASERHCERLKLLNKDVFCFNSDDNVYDNLKINDFAECRFLIHPIFYEYLDLEPNSVRMILDIDWDYLKNQEAHFAISY